MLGGAGLIPAVPVELEVGIPAESLRRRPDILNCSIMLVLNEIL